MADPLHHSTTAAASAADPPRFGQRSQSAGSSVSQSSSARFGSFTEAVPLSLSSVAHASIPLEDGVLDGIRQVLQHSMFSCVNYARIMHPPHDWTFRDLTASPYAWDPVKVDGDDTGDEDGGGGASSSSSASPSDVPFALSKMGFKHRYARHALIYLQAALPTDLTAELEADRVKDWSQHVGVLGKVSLLYVSTEPLTRGEMDGTDVDDMPPCIMYKTVVEYRTLPPTGNQQAIQAEELSMLSFGGSVDDCIKYGALASLYDVDAKYVLEIYSTRGKKYKFDLMDSTLSNGMVPRLPSSRDGDPFVKSLCVTVTDHELRENVVTKPGEEKKYAVTRMQLLLEGKPRKGKDFTSLPPFGYFASNIRAAYLNLNPHPPDLVTALPSGHRLLLHPAHAGRVYVNGSYVTTWGQDPRIGCQGTALFGMDLHSIPMWHNRIVNYEAVKLAYGQLWHEVLVDARLVSLNLATRLLYRLIKGRDPDDEEGGDLYDDDADASPDVNLDCLEALVMSSGKYDPVGISPKALATRFAAEFGANAFPCQSHEVEWVRSLLPDRKPVIVPRRAISVLHRGGYHDAQRTSDDLWFLATRQPREGPENATVLAALRMLEESGCDDVSYEQIAFTSMPPPASDVIRQNLVCRYSEGFQQFCIHDNFFYVPVERLLRDAGADASFAKTDDVRAFLLGMYIAKEHPDGKVLARYLLKKLDLTPAEISM
jgi:hypothetical protein